MPLRLLTPSCPRRFSGRVVKAQIGCTNSTAAEGELA